MIKTLPFIFCFFLASTIAHSQAVDFEHFRTLKSAGPVPNDFTVRPSVKFNEEKTTLEGDTKTEISDKETFLLESNYMLEDLLNSGRVVFGDPVSKYLNSIKDEILKDDPELRSGIRIYTYLSNDVNAFTFDNGIVLVTTGLLAQVQNEAQVAFVLCHEFIHYKNKHAITSYVENRKIERGTGVYASLSREDESALRFGYAKDLESEADEQGFELYKKTKYSYDAIEGVFDVLLYSYLPIDEVPFDKTFFNDAYYKLPETLFLDSLHAITAEADYDDSESTHPNISKRKKEIMQRVPVNENSGRSLYTQSKETFDNIQKICRYQGCEIYLFDIEYEDALYEAYILMQDDSSSVYLKDVVAQSLYGMAMYKNEHAIPDWHRYFKNVEGESQQVYYLMYKISVPDLDILALKNVWAAHLADPGNTMLMEMSRQLASFIVNDQKIDEDEFLSPAEVEKLKKPEQHADTTSGQGEEIKATKYDKIKQQKAEEDPDYWKLAFTEYINDPAFKELFVEKETQQTTASKSKKKNKKPEYHLGIDNIAVVDPVYVSINERSRNPVQFTAAENSRIALKDIVMEGADELDLHVQYLDHSHMDATNVDEFNDMAVLNRWISEKVSHIDEGIFMLTSTTDEVQEIAAKYGVDYFTWLGVASFTEKEKYVGGKILLCIYLPLAPFLIYNLLTPDRTTYYFALVANAQTGKFEMQYYNVNKLNDSSGTTRSNIFYILKQIKSDHK